MADANLRLRAIRFVDEDRAPTGLRGPGLGGVGDARASRQALDETRDELLGLRFVDIAGEADDQVVRDDLPSSVVENFLPT